MRDGEDGDARLALGGVEKTPNVQGLALEPGAEARGCQEVVELNGEFHPALLGVDTVEVHDADGCEGGLLDVADEVGKAHAAPGVPGGLDDVGEEDVLAAADGVGVNAEQGQEARDGALDGLAEQLGVLHVRGGLQRAQDADGPPGGAPRRIEGYLSGSAQHRDA